MTAKKTSQIECQAQDARHAFQWLCLYKVQNQTPALEIEGVVTWRGDERLVMGRGEGSSSISGDWKVLFPELEWGCGVHSV